MYVGSTITIYGGQGATETATITGYTGSTLTATISGNWTTTPNSTSTYIINHVITAGNSVWSSGITYYYYNGTATLGTTTSFQTATASIGGGNSCYPIARYDGKTLYVYGSTVNGNNGNSGMPIIVGFKLSGVARLSVGDAFQIIGETNNNGYNEFEWIVDTLDSTTNTITAVYTANFALGTFGNSSTTYVLPANHDINVIGGTWNCNAEGMSDYASSGSMNAMCFVINQANKTVFDSNTFVDGVMNTIYTCNTRNFTIKNHFDRNVAGGPQLSAPFINTLIDGFESNSIDDGISSVEGVGPNTQYAALTLTNQASVAIPRDRYNLTIKNGIFNGPQPMSIYGGYGTIHNTVIENVFIRNRISTNGTSPQNWKASSVYPQFSQLLAGGYLYVNLGSSGTSGSTVPSSWTTGTVSDGTVTWTYMNTPATYSHKGFSIKNVTFLTTNGIAADGVTPQQIIANGGGSSIDDLVIDGITVANTSEYGGYILNNNTGSNIDKLNIKNLTFKTPGFYGIGIINLPGNNSGTIGVNGVTMPAMTTAGTIVHTVIENSAITFDLSTLHSKSINSFLVEYYGQTGGTLAINNCILKTMGTTDYTYYPFLAYSNTGGSVRFETNNCYLGAYIKPIGSGMSTFIINSGINQGPLYGGTNANVPMVFNGVTSDPNYPVGQNGWINQMAEHLVLNDCNVQCDTTGAQGYPCVVQQASVTCKSLKIKGGSYTSFTGSTNNYLSVLYNLSSTLEQLVFENCYMNYGTLLRSGGSINQISCKGVSFGSSSTYALNLQNANNYNITFMDCFAEGAFTGGSVINSGSSTSSTTLKINVIGCNFSSSVLGSGGTSVIETVNTMGWWGTGTLGSWGTTPTYTHNGW